MSYGTLTLNNVTDEQLVDILEIKEKHETSLHFDPAQMRNCNILPPPPFPPRAPYYPPPRPGFPYTPLPPQPVIPPQPPAQPGTGGYDNVILTWNNADGLKAVAEILDRVVGPAS